MHTTEVMDQDSGVWVCHHNGDFSGEVILIPPRIWVMQRASRANWDPEKIRRIEDMPNHEFAEQFEMQVPARVMFYLVGTHVISERISKLEQMTPDEVLGLA
jgi:hypothetical protein